ncbi:MAG: hypothetical protein Q8900_12900 [Bacillota bacterium]|nr:hypothetical protein [Bacillota bacterium]
MIKRFIIYGLSGLCIEVLWSGFFSFLRGDIRLTGHTYIWMFLIYGMAIFLEPIHDRIKHLPFILRGGIYTILIFIAEFTTGFLLRCILGVCPWQYNDTPLNILGLIAFSYAPVWFIVGLLFEKLHYLLKSIEFKQSNY